MPVSKSDSSKHEFFQAGGIYLFFAVLIYWPVFSGLRFFWEDFTNQEYPIRDFAFTSIGLLHHLPLWNPYSWAWAAFSADPQSALWYPTNILQIFLTRILMPSAQHLPTIMPEMMTILHLPFAALGMYLLARRRFALRTVPALLAGFMFGFGTRMIAEQNHQMTVYQWLWLPWCAYFMLRALTEYRYLFVFALALGLSYLAGQPQLSLFNSTFLASWACYELWQQHRDGIELSGIVKRGSTVLCGFMLAAGVSAVQYIPSIELSNASARASLSYNDAGGGSITVGQLVNFFVPRILGENPREDSTGDRTMIEAKADHWEATFSWSVFGEVLAAFAVWKLWHRRKNRNDPHTRDLRFFLGFSLFALLFGLGYHLGFQWIIWKFVPLYDRVRNPARMIVYLSFAGAVLGGIGLQLLSQEAAPNSAKSHKFLLKALSPFLLLSLVGVFDILDLFQSHTRSGVWYLSLPTLLVTFAAILYVLEYVGSNHSSKLILTGAAAIILVDLFYNAFTWHRSPVDPQKQFEQAMHSEAGQIAMSNWKNSITKMLAARGDSGDIVRNAGMYSRVPIEAASDSISLRWRNPMRLNRAMVPAHDSLLAWKIMGVSTRFDTAHGPQLTRLSGALPFLKLYQSWRVASGDTGVAALLSDSNFDYQHVLIVEGTSQPVSADTEADSSAIETSYISEDSIACRIRLFHPSMLFVNDLYYSKWRATVDGHPTPVIRAFSSLRAVWVDRGEHEVLLYYDDGSLRLGEKISIGAIAVCLIGMIVLRKQLTGAS